MTGRRTGPDADTVQLVRARDSWTCVRCGLLCGPLTTQHRQARGMGGTTRPAINAPSNLITLGGSGTTGDHGWVEAHPIEAQRLGMAVARWADPSTVPVLTWRGWVLLHDDGSVTPTTEPADGDAHAVAERWSA